MIRKKATERRESTGRHEDHLFFLAQDGRILATRSTRATPRVGECFFDAFPMSREEHAELYRLLNGYGNSCALFRAGRKTVLFLTAFYAATGCFIALVPTGMLAGVLDRPAAVEGLLPHVSCSTEVRRRMLPPNELQYHILHDYILSWAAPLYFDRALRHTTSARAVQDALILHAELIADLTDCKICYDFSGFGFAPICNPLLERVVGLLFLLCLAARRAARDRALSLAVEYREDELPFCAVALTLREEAGPFPELEGLIGNSHARSFLVQTEREGARVTVRWHLCNRELALLGCKHPELYEEPVPTTGEAPEPATDQRPATAAGDAFPGGEG